MRSITARRMTGIAAAVLSAGALVSVGAPTATAGRPTAATGAGAVADYQGCATGNACLYPDASWNGGRPSATYYRYGAYNLSGQFGVKRFFNNQTGNARAAMCTGYNGGGTCYYQPAYTYSDRNFTPINSIVLSP